MARRCATEVVATRRHRTTQRIVGEAWAEELLLLTPVSRRLLAAYAVSCTAIEVQHADRLGSIRAVTDGTGAVIATYRTDEFGIPTTSTGAAGSPFRYTGEPLDASGLTYLRARHYDASTGRFLSRDPFAGASVAPLSLNRYGYVHNNPVTWSDPSGRCVPPATVLCVAGAVVTVEAGAAFLGFLAAVGATIIGVGLGEAASQVYQRGGGEIPRGVIPRITIPTGSRTT